MIRFIYPRRLRYAFIFRRFIARWADIGIVFLSFRLLLRPLGLVVWPSSIDWYASLAVSMITNALLLNLFGTTAWKWVWGLRVEKISGGTPELFLALKRECLVAIFGVGCGIPLLTVPANIYWGWLIMTGRRSFWNQQLDLISSQTHSLWCSVKPRASLIAAIIAGMILVIELWLILFRAARFEGGWIIYGL